MTRSATLSDPSRGPIRAAVLAAAPWLGRRATYPDGPLLRPLSCAKSSCQEWQAGGSTELAEVRRVELLDRCVTKLEKHDQPELALRLLKRYTTAKFETPREWRKWLDDNRSRLFFSDVGGYKFFVAPSAMSATKNHLQTKN